MKRHRQLTNDVLLVLICAYCAYAVGWWAFGADGAK